LLGVSLPDVGDGMQNLGRHVGDAARQFGRLASEVHAAREQVEKVGKALS
jgi:hypothetical protein